MECQNCNAFLYFTKKYKETVLDKYSLIFVVNSSDVENNFYFRINPKIYVLFEKLIAYINENNNLDVFRKLKNHINEDFIVKCENCGFNNKITYSLMIANEFYIYVDNYIDFIIENTIEKITNKSLHDFSIYIGVNNYEILFDNLPHEYKKIKRFLKKLYYVRDITPVTFEGGAGGLEVLEWLLEQSKIYVFGLILNLIITGGGKLKEFIKSLIIRKKISKKIKNYSRNWNDISLENLRKYISIPKDYKGSKEELIEQILKIKFKEYKNEIIEKLRQ